MDEDINSSVCHTVRIKEFLVIYYGKHIELPEGIGQVYQDFIYIIEN